MRFKNLKKSQLLFNVNLIILFLCSLFFTFTLDKGFAQSEEERTAQLVKGARKEGLVRLCTGMATIESDRILKRFNKKYPFIKTDLFRSTGQKMVSKLLAEDRAGIHNFDVFSTSFSVHHILKKHGFFTKYMSPQSKYFPNSLKDPEGYWTDHYSSYFVMGYNTKLVSSQEAPKNYTDLLDPKWKGKLSMDNKAFEWLAGLLRTLGEENGLKYFEKLSGQDIYFRRGKTLIAQLLAAGEFSIGITLYRNRLEEMKSLGAPVEWIALEPVITMAHPVSMSAHTPRTNAAKLLVDFILSEEGQEMLGDYFRVPSRNGVKARGRKFKKDLQLLPYDSSFLDDYNRHAKLFRQILLEKRR
jgi:ABC-type Fe3+ transport system substrate-binding protein